MVDEVSCAGCHTAPCPDRASPVQDPAAYDVARIRLPLPECALRLMNAAEEDYDTLVAQLKGTTWRANPPPEEDADFNQIWKVPRPCWNTAHVLPIPLTILPRPWSGFGESERGGPGRD